MLKSPSRLIGAGGACLVAARVGAGALSGIAGVLGLLAVAAGLVTGGAAGDAALAAPPPLVDLDDREYQAVYAAADWLDHLAVMPPPDGAVGLYLVFGDRFGLVHVYHLTHGASRDLWKSKQLDGIVEEVLITDLDRDGGDEIIARTTGSMIYVWDSGDLRPRYESLKADFTKVHSLTFGNVDDDPALELIVNADSRIHYVDGRSFNREWTSLNEYEATRMACGDVDGDRKNEVVLNTGQVLDARTGEVEWSDEVFGSRVQLLDIDGDGVLEVLTEGDGTVLRVYDVDLRKEKHLQ